MTNPTGDALKASADESIAWYLNMWNEGDEDVRSEIYWGRPSGDAIQWAEHNGHDIEHLYARPAALSPVEQSPQPVAVVTQPIGFMDVDGLGALVDEVRSRPTPTEAPPVESQAALRAALNRQCDNMAFVINHMTIPAQYYEKFMRELEEDRDALAAEGSAE